MPETRYARSGDVNIAYQVVGDGPTDIVYVPGWVSNIELMWDDPGLASFLRRLSSFARLITFDKRGTGLSDPVPLDNLPDFTTRMDDLRAVMDAAGSRSATIFGHYEGGSLSILFAATHPDRTDGLILTGSYAKRIRSDDYPWAPTAEERAREAEHVAETWGQTEWLEEVAPSRSDDPAFKVWFSRYLRMSASPRAAAALLEMNSSADVRGALKAVTAPALLLYRRDDRDVNRAAFCGFRDRGGATLFAESCNQDDPVGVGKGLEQRRIEDVLERLTTVRLIAAFLRHYAKIRRWLPLTQGHSVGCSKGVHSGVPRGCSSVRQSASLARKRPGVQIPSPPRELACGELLGNSVAPSSGPK